MVETTQQRQERLKREKEGKSVSRPLQLEGETDSDYQARLVREGYSLTENRNHRDGETDLQYQTRQRNESNVAVVSDPQRQGETDAQYRARVKRERVVERASVFAVFQGDRVLHTCHTEDEANAVAGNHTAKSLANGIDVRDFEHVISVEPMELIDEEVEHTDERAKRRRTEYDNSFLFENGRRESLADRNARLKV